MQNYNNDTEFASKVTMKDIALVKKMDKDELKKWTNQPSTFNLVIDTTRSIVHLRNQVVGLIKARIGNEAEKKVQRGESLGDLEKADLSLGYLFNPTNRRVFEATPALLKREDFVPCDRDGNRITE